MAAEDVGVAEGTGAEMGKKTGLFFTLGVSCATVCGVGATCRCSEVTKLKQILARVFRPAPERLFLIYGPH